jgi:hypothetical protein
MTVRFRYSDVANADKDCLISSNDVYSFTCTFFPFAPEKPSNQHPIKVSQPLVQFLPVPVSVKGVESKLFYDETNSNSITHDAGKHGNSTRSDANDF